MRQPKAAKGRSLRQVASKVDTPVSCYRFPARIYICMAPAHFAANRGMAHFAGTIVMDAKTDLKGIVSQDQPAAVASAGTVQHVLLRLQRWQPQIQQRLRN